MFFVYRFLNNEDKIIYVGKTKSLDARMKQHFGAYSHLPSECYEETIRIEYITLPSKADMDIKELYYINKWKPKYNSKNKQDEPLSFEIKSEEHWELFVSKDEEYIQNLEKKIINLGHQIKDLEYEISQKNVDISTKTNQIIEHQVEINDLALKFDELHIQLNNKSDIVFINDSSNNAKNHTRLFTMEEIEIMFEEGLQAYFVSTVTSNGEVIFKLTVYVENNEIYIKDILTNEKRKLSSSFTGEGFKNITLALLSDLVYFRIEENIPIEAAELILNADADRRKLRNMKMSYYDSLFDRNTQYLIFKQVGRDKEDDFINYLWDNWKEYEDGHAILKTWLKTIGKSIDYTNNYLIS